MAAGAAESSADFYARLPVFAGFAEIMDPSRYRPLPGDWLVAVTDVVRSTEAIARGERPDLSGLSCRWNDIPATRGVMLSLVVAPVRHGDVAIS